MRTIAAFLILASVAFADLPKAVINGPTEGMPGDFIDLDASASVGDFYEWKVEPSQFSDGRKTYRLDRGAAPQKSIGCGIASRPGKYKVTLVVANDEGIATKDWEVTIFASPPGTPPPTNPPPNNPPPNNPPPNQPPVNTPLVEWVKSNVQALVVDDGRRKKTAALLANSYKGFAVSGGVAKNPAEFAKGQDFLNKAVFALTGTGQQWDKFMRALAEHLAAMNMTVRQQQEAWMEIAAGLEAIQ